MNGRKLRSLAALLSMGVGAVAQAQDVTGTQDPAPYATPAKWNNFYPASLYQQDLSEGGSSAAPLPDAQTNLPESSATLSVIGEPSMSEATEAAMMGVAGCQDASCVTSDSRLPLRPWFGSLNLLLWNLENECARPVASGVGGLSTDAVAPGTTPGFEGEIGRYLGDGRYAVGVSYMLWNPESERVGVAGAAGSIIPYFPGYRDISINVLGNGEATVYDYITGAGPGAGATEVRMYRDLFVQGIEANLYCFGLMGSRRVSYPNCNSAGCLGIADCLCSDCYGYGGAAGPLTRPDSGRIRVTSSHGFRWFQLKDRIDFDYNIDGQPGFQEGDIYECYHVENDLLGYQFGSQLNYCINSCWSMNVGGKFGMYGNNARMSHMLSSTTAAFRTGTSDLINTSDNDTSLATLGELDLGLGRRIGCAWTLRGGYRLMGVTGVATAPGSIIDSYATTMSSRAVCANDSLVLHGAYLGLDYNW
jgi:hypothetical protein